MAKIPERIGPYRILEVLGQGGMGTVFLAEQMQPVRRKVALKIVKQAVEGDLVLARFRLECQILALMNHPNIAVVYEAGTTPEGLPFLAMEYMDGKPLTEYCDAFRLATRERLGLFLSVCEGIQHAHGKMIIHRDLKPENIVVVAQGGRVVPKVIDFGIAKAVARGQHVELTQPDGPIGTPLYMSPEQIEGDPADLDARVDVYALGVLLYELLAGTTPYDMRAKGPHHMMKAVLEEEVPRPSTKLTAMGNTLGEIAEKRRADPKTLRGLLKGDLDWIILKALQKDREQRYGSVAELKSDIERHLHHIPILAKPPTLLYRGRKFLRRNKLAVALGMVLITILILGVLGSTYGMIQADRARIKAEDSESKAHQTVAYLQQILGSVDPSVDGRSVLVVDLLQKASGMISHELRDQPEIEASIRKTLGWTFLELGMYGEAEAELDRAYAIQKEILGEFHLESLKTANAKGRLFYKKGFYSQAEAVHRRVFKAEKKLQGLRHPTTQWTMYNLAKALDKQGKWSEAEELYRLNVAIRRSMLGESHPHTLVSINSLGLLLGDRGKLNEAEALLRSNLIVLKRVSGANHPNSINAMANLVEILNQQGEFAESKSLAEQTLVLQEKIYGPNHPETLGTMSQMALALGRNNDPEAALAFTRETLDLQRRHLGGEHPDVIETTLILARILCEQGFNEESEALFREMFGPAKELYSGTHWRLAVYKAQFGRCLVDAGELAEAKPLLLSSLDVLRKTERIERRLVLNTLADLYEKEGNPTEAQRFRGMREF